MLRRDGRYDGKFYVGVVTTGIYCLPSCLARKPKIENVRIFGTEREAQGAGLRACKRCRPNLFGRAEPADEAAHRALITFIAEPESGVLDAQAVARGCGVSKTKAQQLARSMSHVSLASLVRRHRVNRAARELIATNERVMDVCFASGFESEATFHRQFTSIMGLAPGSYRALRESSVFAMALPAGYRTTEVLAFHGRDDASPCERVSGTTLTKALTIDGADVVVEVAIGRTEALCRLVAGRHAPDLMVGVHAAVRRLLGFDSETSNFERLMRLKGLGQLIGGRSGLRIPLTATAFEGLTWAIIGQQINLTFASKLRRALIESYGRRIDGLSVHPSPDAIANLDSADLLRLQFSRQKARYLIDAGQAVSQGTLALETLRNVPAARAEQKLTSLKGIGTWTARYTMLRGIGFGDCVPVGDAGLRIALQRFHGLPERPDDEKVERLMRPFSPHRSLATAHLWASLSSS